ncbi:MAG: hypothetical protein ABSD74_15505 [Rhizomicrobium sp.]|jgi:hypothetical protein
MSIRYSLAAAAALLGVVMCAAPASAVMQVVPMPDPNAPAQGDGPPDGLFDKSVGDHWQKPGTDGDQNTQNNPFHFTVSGSQGYGGSTSTSNASAYDQAKQPNSEFYQPMPGSPYPFYGH